MRLSGAFMRFRALHSRLNELIKGAIQRMAQESSLTGQAKQMSEQLAQLQQVQACGRRHPTDAWPLCCMCTVLLYYAGWALPVLQLVLVDLYLALHPCLSGVPLLMHDL